MFITTQIINIYICTAFVILIIKEVNKMVKRKSDFEKYKYYILGGAGLLVLVAVLLMVFWAPSTEGTTAKPIAPSRLVTYQGVLNMLNRCNIFSTQTGQTCDAVCGGVSKICIFAEAAYQTPQQGVTFQCSNAYGNFELHCMCCSP